MQDARKREHTGNCMKVARRILDGTYIYYWYRTFYMTKAKKEYGTVIGHFTDEFGVRWYHVVPDGEKTTIKRKISTWDIIRVGRHDKWTRRRHDPMWVEREL